MRSTFRLMGIADFITLFNGLLGSLAIMFIILAVEDMQNPYLEGGLKADYIWAAMLCILLSALGDIIDGPIARRYSKRRLLGGSLDLMSDTISFALAPALLVFVMFGRMGESTPLWTVMIAISCCWLVVCGMLRLARFEHEKGSDNSFFVGISSPASAMLIISLSGLIWLQPISGFGPELTTWDCSVCFGKGAAKPWGDFILLPAMMISGGLMISDWKTSKLKHGLPLKLTIVQFIALLSAIIYALIYTSNGISTSTLSGMVPSFIGFTISSALVVLYIVAGPRIIPRDVSSEES
jgi:phosphatidylserine synthase